MKKLKIQTVKIGKFLREIAVIVIGVAITLAASYWVTNRNEKKDMALYLHAIKLELEENIKYLEDISKNSIRDAINYSDYLMSHEKKSLNLDSLVFYRNKTAFNLNPVMVKTNAFDMFKVSGNMRLMKNKELLLSLWEVYGMLDVVYNFFEQMRQVKLNEMKKYFYQNSLPDEELLKNPPMYDFYVNMYVPYVQKSTIDTTLKSLKETMLMFE